MFLSSDPSLFLKFVNAIINDAIFLLDESLSKLTEIRNYQLEMQDRATWLAQEAVQPNVFSFFPFSFLLIRARQETRQEREQHFRSLERQVKTYLLLGNETINVLHYLTETIIDPFLR